jgi:hypothetical protein
MRAPVARVPGGRTRHGGAWITLLLLGAAVATILASITPALQASPASSTSADASSCAPGVDLLGFSDALDKRTFEGTNVGGLSRLTYDATRDLYYGLIDNEGTTPARFYTLRLPTEGQKLGRPRFLDVTILRDENGQPFTGATLDWSGDVVLTPQNPETIVWQAR